MSNEIIFYTQIGSILGFIVALFILYRLLVTLKDATIEQLKERADYFEKQLLHAERQGPDALASSLHARVTQLTDELERLAKDKQNNQAVISEREVELTQVKREAGDLWRQIDTARELMSEYFCPSCQAPMAERLLHSESDEVGDFREVDIDHEYVTYECGAVFLDDEEERPCRRAEGAATRINNSLSLI